MGIESVDYISRLRDVLFAHAAMIVKIWEPNLLVELDPRQLV